MSRTFDPIPLLVRFTHKEACGQSHAFDLSECPAAQAAAENLAARLGEAGLVLMPSSVASFLARRFLEMTEDTPAPDAADMLMPRGVAWPLYHELVRIRQRWHDGRLTYTEPMRRWLAEIVLIDYNLTHERGVVGARIEPTPTPLNALFARLGASLKAQA